DAEQHLREALYEMFQSWQAAHKDHSSWLSTPQSSSRPYDVPPGYFLLAIALLMALIFAERGCDLPRARRKLRFVDRPRNFLGNPPATANRRARRDFESRCKAIAARYEDYLGWVCHLDNQPRLAREHLEASIRIRADPEAFCHLARFHLDHGEPARARK